jgi:hypothetical protein
MTVKTTVRALKRPQPVPLLSWGVAVALVLGGCASKEQRAAMETQFDKSHRQPVVAEMNAVAKYVKAEHLAACKAHIEAQQTLFGLKFRLVEPLAPHAGSTCAAIPFIFAPEGVQRAAYLARAEPYGSASVGGTQLKGCTMELKDGKIDVKFSAPLSVQQNGRYSHCSRL